MTQWYTNLSTKIDASFLFAGHYWKNIKLNYCFSLVLSFLIIVVFSLTVEGQQIIKGSIPQAVEKFGLQPIGQLNTTSQLHFTIGLPLRNQKALDSLLQQIYDPTSPNYHHYLTVQQFTDEFGPTEADYQKVISFLKANGLKVSTPPPNRMLIDVNGKVSNVEKALNVTMNLYHHPSESRTFFAPNHQPSLNLTVPILSIRGLNNYHHTRPHIEKITNISNANYVNTNAGSGPSGTYMGYDFRAAYAPNVSLTGTGQTVGLVAFDGYTPNDITYYENQAGLPNVPLQNVKLGNFNGNPTGNGEDEVSLDIEMAVSMAPGLSKVVIYEAPPDSVGYYAAWDYLLNRMTTDNLAKQLSCSWYINGGGTDATAEQIFQEMAAQGQSFFNASGDADAYTGLISFPGDSPNITQVGGTELTTNGSGGPYSSETVWYDNNGVGSGGGVSTNYTIPSWQQDIDMSNNQGSTTMRNTPDVALVAKNIYVRVDGSDQNVEGTSAAAPLWAGFAALANQQANSQSISPIGFINPTIDPIGHGNSHDHSFHDIATGNNTSSSSPNKFYAELGYDLCTGWGSPNGMKMIDYLLAPGAPIMATSITSNTTLSNKYYRITQNVYTSNGATLTIPNGVRIFIAANKEIVVQPGSKIVANGSSSNPIHFMRLDPTQEWATINLQGNGNTFTWCLFEGANYNVAVESESNYFTDCTFRDASRGISSYWNQSGGSGLSYFKLDNCMVEDNTSVGVVVYHTDAAFYQSTVQHNASAGVWLYDCPARYFYKTAIINNAYNASRDVVEVVGGSDVDLLVYNSSVGYFPGYNRIAYNTDDQVSVDASSSLVMGDASTGDWGDNGIFGGSGYLVNNQSSTTVDAYGNWWGTSSPPSSFFSGSVDYSGSLSSDPSTSAGVGSNNYPQQKAPINSETMMTQSVPHGSNGKPGLMASNSANRQSLTSNERNLRKERMHFLVGQLGEATDAQSIMNDMRQLYKLQLMSRGDTSFTSEVNQNRALWGAMIQHFLSGTQKLNPGGITLSASQIETLMLMDEHEAYRFGRYDEAQKKVKEYAPYITSTTGKIVNMTDQMNLLDRRGSYQEALTMLDKIKDAEVSLGQSKETVDAQYEIASEELQNAIVRGKSNLASSGMDGTLKNLEDSSTPFKPGTTALNANYPNPFNPTTTISYQLARDSHVRLMVYDVLGRRVATLVDANQQKGIHRVAFNASQLASGIYFYRMQAGNKVLVKKMLLMK